MIGAEVLEQIEFVKVGMSESDRTGGDLQNNRGDIGWREVTGRKRERGGGNEEGLIRE